jgi:hypothetical protein
MIPTGFTVATLLASFKAKAHIMDVEEGDTGAIRGGVEK